MLQGKPDHNRNQWLNRKTSSRESTYKEKNIKEAIVSATCSILLYSDWLWQYCLLMFPPTNRTEWTPQATIPSRDTKRLILKNMKKKRKKKRRRGYLKTWFGYGHLIWCWTNQVVPAERGSGCVPDQTPPCDEVVQRMSWIQMNQRQTVNRKMTTTEFVTVQKALTLE